MFVLVLKILGPVFLFGVSVVREWSMLRDKSTHQRAALVLGMGAVVTIVAAIGLVIDHNNQAAKLAAEQEDSAELRQKVTETLEGVTRARPLDEALDTRRSRARPPAWRVIRAGGSGLVG